MAKDEVVGQLTEKNECEPLIFKEVSWKIAKVSSLLRSDDTEVRSSAFSFANANWTLRTKDVVHFELCRQGREAGQEVYYKFFIKSSHGEELQNFTSCHNFSATSREDGGDLFHFRTRSKLAAYLKEIVRDDTLTVFCQMHTESKLEKATSQEDIVGPVKNDVVERNDCGSFIFKEVTWKIPDFLNLPLEFTGCVKSPEFSFANGRWILSTTSMDGEDTSMLFEDTSTDDADTSTDGNETRTDDNDTSTDDNDTSTDDEDTSTDDEDASLDDEDEQFFNLCRLHSLEGEQEVYFKFFLKSSDGQKLKNFIGCHNYTSMVNEDENDCYMKKSELKAKLRLANDNALIVICRMHTKRTAPVSQEEVISPVMADISSETDVAQLTKVLSDYENLLLNEDGCDITLRVGETHFQAHGAILRARSPVFASMLRSNMKESSTGVVDIVDCDPESFPDFLRFLYCGNVGSITTRNVCSLYRAADKYDVQDFKSGCLMFMKRHLSVDNFCDIIALALRYSETDLVERATDFFIENVAKIVVTVKWQEFLMENPIQGNELFIKTLPANKNS